MKIKHVVVLLLTCILNCRIEYGATKYILLKIQLHSLGAHSVESSSQPLQKHEIEGRHSKVGADEERDYAEENKENDEEEDMEKDESEKEDNEDGDINFSHQNLSDIKPIGNDCFAYDSKFRNEYKCVLPFRYKGHEWQTCTYYDTHDDKPWCSTKVDEKGIHIPGHFGHCSKGCSPYEGGKNVTSVEGRPFNEGPESLLEKRKSLTLESHTKQKLHGDRVKGISAFGQSDHFRKEQNFNTTDNLNENTITSTELNKEIIDDTKEGTVDSMRTSGEDRVCPPDFPNLRTRHENPRHGDVCRNEKVHGYKIGWVCPKQCALTWGAPFCQESNMNKEPCRVNIGIQGSADLSEYKLSVQGSADLSEYNLSEKHVCNGTRLDTWDNNKTANYGEMKGVSNCTEECNLHDECGGFSLHHDGTCGFWNRQPFQISAEPSFDCYEKKIENSKISGRSLLSSARQLGPNNTPGGNAQPHPPPGSTGTDIGTLLSLRPELKMFLTIWKNAGSFGMLQQPGSYTLLAPNNDAFEKIKDRLPNLLSNSQKLTEVMLSHLIPQKIKKYNINQGSFQVQTVGGKPIQITKSFMKITINDRAELIRTDIEGSNGVIHIIDEVILEDDERYKKEGEDCTIAEPLVSGGGKAKNCGQCEEGLTCQLTFNLLFECGKCTKQIGTSV